MNRQDRLKRAVEITRKYCGKHMNLAALAGMYKVSTSTIRKAIEDCKEVDIKLYEQAIAKVNMYGNVAKKNQIPDFTEEMWNKLSGKTLLRNDILDYYIKNGGSEYVTVGKVLDQAKDHGIKIIVRI